MRTVGQRRGRWTWVTCCRRCRGRSPAAAAVHASVAGRALDGSVDTVGARPIAGTSPACLAGVVHNDKSLAGRDRQTDRQTDRRRRRPCAEPAGRIRRRVHGPCFGRHSAVHDRNSLIRRLSSVRPSVRPSWLSLFRRF